MHLFCCQLDTVWEDKRANYAKLERALVRAQPPRGSLVVLPELCFTGFSLNLAAVAEGESGRSEPFLADLARQFNVQLLAGVARRSPAGRGRNEAVLVTADGAIGARYQKLHLFSPAREGECFEPGRRVVTFPWQQLQVAPFLGYDLQFPEIFRAAVDLGAELYAVMANWPSSRQGAWRPLLRARAIENQAFVVGVNRCGHDPHDGYAGHSVVVAPNGEILAEADEKECMLHVELDPGAVHEWRLRMPALADRRSRAPASSGGFTYRADGPVA